LRSVEKNKKKKSFFCRFDFSLIGGTSLSKVLRKNRKAREKNEDYKDAT